jgi:putative membrane protein
MTQQPEETPPAPCAHYDAADPRIYFAAERTLLAWVRTGLAMMGFGFVVARFGLFLRAVSPHAGAAPSGMPGLSGPVGTALVILGVLVNVAAARKYQLTLRRLRQGQPIATRNVGLEMVVALLLAVIGIGMAMYLLLHS